MTLQTLFKKGISFDIRCRDYGMYALLGDDITGHKESIDHIQSFNKVKTWLIDKAKEHYPEKF